MQTWRRAWLAGTVLIGLAGRAFAEPVPPGTVLPVRLRPDFGAAAAQLAIERAGVQVVDLDTSAELASILTDETGTAGKAVFDTQPIFQTSFDLEDAGVRFSAANGVLTLAGIGDGQDENLLFDFNATANTIGVSSGTSAATITFSGFTLSPTNLDLTAGGALRTATSAGNTFLFQAYDTDTGPAYTTVATMTAGANPSVTVTGLADGTASAPSLAFADNTNTGIYSSGSNEVGIATNGNLIGRFFTDEFNINNDAGALSIGTGRDVVLAHDAANILGQRNGANDQTYRIYQLYTDTSNYEFGSLAATAGAFTISAGTLGTGTDNIDLVLTPIGTGDVLLGTDNAFDIGATGANRPASIFLADPAITVGSGTGVTVNNTGEPRTLVYKVTIASTAFVCADVTCDKTIATLPAKTFVKHAMVDLTTQFACTGVCTSSTLSATLGKTAGGNEYLLSFDADAAVAQFGDAAAELGASLAPATVQTLNGDLGSWSGTTAVVMRLTSGTGNIGDDATSNLSQGSVTFYLTTTVMP